MKTPTAYCNGGPFNHSGSLRPYNGAPANPPAPAKPQLAVTRKAIAKPALTTTPTNT